jgi:hypothetical protein
MSVIEGVVTEEAVENRVLFRINTMDHMSFTGFAQIHARGGEDEEHFKQYDVEIVVGPWWRAVRQVTPMVTVSFWSHKNSDEDDNSGWAVDKVTWDTVGGTGAHLEQERIQIRCRVSVKGEHAQVVTLGYYVHGRGLLGDQL